MKTKKLTPRGLAERILWWGLKDGMSLREANELALNKVKGFLAHLEGKPAYSYYRQVQDVLEAKGVNRKTRRGQTNESKNARGA